MKLKIRGKINTFVLSGLLLLCCVFAGICAYISITLMESNIETSLKFSMNYLVDFINIKYPGDFTLNESTILKGDFDLTHSKVLDELKSKTNIEYTIFAKDIRISSSIDDATLIGTTADSKIAHTVLDEGKYYHGTTSINNQKYAAYYSPIINVKGDIIGMFFV